MPRPAYTDGSPSLCDRWGRRSDLVFYAVLAILAVLMLVRAAYGTEWYGDESYALGTPMRYVAGDHPIVDSWESHFSSGILLTPFVWVLEKTKPDGTGIVLMFRYLFVAMQAIYAFALWRLIRPHAPSWAAIVTSCAAFLYVPYFYLIPYYNSIMLPAMMLSALALLRAFTGDEGRSGRWLVASGVLAGVGIIAYPTMLLALPFFCTGIVLEARRRSDSGDGLVRRTLVAFLGSMFAALGVFAVVTIAASGMRHLPEALPYFLHPVDRDISLSGLVSRLERTWTVLIAPAAAVLVFAVGALIARKRRAPLAGVIVATIVATIAVAFVVYRVKAPSISFLDMPQATALGIGMVVPLMMLCRRDARTDTLFRLLCIPAFGLGVGTLVASHEGFETAAMPAVIAMIATLLVLAGPRGGERDARWIGPAVALPVVGAALVAAFFLFIGAQYTAGDAAVRQLGTTITTGPYAGLHTTADNAALYMSYMKQLQPLEASTGRIAFLEEFPQGYLFTGRLPGTYSVWTTFATGDRLQRYLNINGNYPDDIVATRFTGPNGGVAAKPFAPPFGLTAFAKKYKERYRTQDFVVYGRVTK